MWRNILGGKKHRRKRSRSRIRRLSHEPLERRLVLAAPTVSFTTPDLDNNPDIPAGLSSIKIKYDQAVVGGGNTANYDLRGPGPDTLYDTADDAVVTFNVGQYSGRTGTVKFDKPPAGDYRFQVKDTITNAAGEALDGDANGSPGGTYERTFTIIPGDATKFSLTGFPSVTYEGTANNFTLTALDAYSNVATGYSGTVEFTSSDAAATLPADYAFTAADAGSRVFSITLNTLHNSTWIKATDDDDGFFKSQTGIQVLEAADVGFLVTGYPATTAGVSNPFTVTAIDPNGDPVPTYIGTVAFTSSDSQATLPANYTFLPADQGTQSFNATLRTAGMQSITVTDVSTGDAGTQSGIVVSPAAASKLRLEGLPATTAPGETHPVTVTARDTYDNVATGYAGTVAFSSNDPAAILPANYTFTAADVGVRQFDVTLNTPGTRWIKVEDASAGFSHSQTGIIVTPVSTVAASFEVTGYPSPTTAGLSNNFVVTAVDANGDIVTDYTGTVTFTNTDPLAAIPADYTFTLADHGDKTFSATFKTAGLQTLSVTDVDTGITGALDVDVLPAALKRFTVDGYPSPVVVATAHNFNVRAEDTYGNTVTNYTGTVTFTGSDPIADLPADYTFTTADQGEKTFSATLFTTGQNRSITATDVATGLFGRQSGIIVQNGAFRYSSTSNIIYVEAPVTATLSDIKFALPNAPLELIDPQNAIWKLDADIRVTVGGTLELHGTSAGGDVNQLRLRSENNSSSDATVEIRADYGNIDILSTEITSWDSAVNGPDTEYATFQRAFIRARSRLAADGVTPLESRMDIVDSHLHHLGYAGSEAYGVSYKVVGDPGPNFELYDQVDVYGDIVDSHIHHNYFGMYSYGAFGMQITGNEVDNNVVYGLDPHDDSDSLTIENNFTHDNGSHGIICSKRCDTLVIRNNNSSDNGGNGIMLHRQTNDSLVENNQTHDNGDSGIAIFDSHNNVIRDNVSSGNKHGIRFSVGSADNLIEDNTFTNNVERGVNFFKGSDTPSPGDDGRPKRNEFYGNTITGNGTYGVRARESDENVFENNMIGPNGSVQLRFEQAVDNYFASNTVPSDTVLLLRGTSNVQTTLFVCDQPGILTNLDQHSEITFCTSAAMQQAAFTIDQARALTFTGDDYLNWGGASERWLKGNDGWYFVLPSGALFKWDGGGQATGELVATFDASYYDDLSKLYDAKQPVDATNTGGSGSTDSGTTSEVDPLAQLAYEIDQARALTFTGDDYLNWGGKNEKWLKGNDGWYFITPDGKLYHWNGSSSASGELVAKLNGSFYSDLADLYDAQQPVASTGETDSNTGGESTEGTGNTAGSGTAEETAEALSALAYELDQKHQLTFTGNDYLNWGGRNERWLQGTGGWYFITPDGRFYHWSGVATADGELLGTLDSSYYDDLSKLHDARVATTESGEGSATVDPLLQLAYEIDQQRQLAFTGNDYRNWGGRDERWVRGNDGWYFITPVGDVYRWDGANSATGALVAQLDATYHTDLGKLYNAQRP